MSYGDHVEQLTYLLFLKMADERGRPPHNQPSPIAAAYAWRGPSGRQDVSALVGMEERLVAL
jgi:hypothetical protein